MIVKPLDEAYLRSHPLPKHSGGDKHSRGRVLVIAGNIELPGAAILAGLGALRAGAGVLRIAACQTNAPHIGAAMPEAMVIRCSEDGHGEIGIGNGPRLVELAKGSDSVLIGSGMVDEGSVGRLCALLLNEAIGPIFVVDASAFTSLRHFDIRQEQRGRLVCTPHFGEMAKFLGREREEIESRALRSATEAARSVHAVVALKGASTHVVGLFDEALLNEQGTVGLATSGSGDTLAGIVAGLAARGTSPLLAAAWGVYLHAVAGRLVADRLGAIGLLARELPEEIPPIMRDLESRT
ncbi:hypothetical protein XF30_13395 [Bradyrhizobium sp. SUTN9-2]|uniref:NAD(P)H-hydrate dehydratase n=1 Tax=Bradyrhizobium sp. SUTN9-2 TaxID=1167456 RepID=UPI000D65917D|nr:NAD(P)H-hydrate dehydratase [Bradyrhizobium sp. SUTN9-2]PWE77588.1 hypothetical protein XF30_13395 [Bradyrhizobium sp. SUTN9-2]